MISKTALLFVIFQSLAVPLAGSSVQQPGDLDAKLNAKVHNYELKSGNLVEALTRVASDFRIPIGIEWVNTPSARRVISLSWKDATVREVIQDVVRTQQSLQMLVGSEVLRVLSPELIPDTENPLKLRIHTFEVKNVPVEFAWRELHEAVKQTISPPKPQAGGEGGIAGSGASNLDDPKISVRMSDATVEDILDKVASISARKVWVVTFSDDPTLTPTGFRRTLSLWNKSTIPDNEQPVWDMFHWNDSIP